MRVLVTDHHLPGAEPPAAACIVNPNQAGCGFPSKNLAGVGVIFYVMMALRAELRRRGAFAGRAEPNLAALLDLVALGTVADVVKLDANNRILVAQGLARIRAGEACAGIRALMAVAGRDAAARGRLRPGVRRRPAPERRRPPRGHDDRHRVPRDGRRRHGARARREARRPEPRAARDRGGHAGFRPRDARRRRSRRGVVAHRAPPGMARGRGGAARLAPQGPLPPPRVRLRRPRPADGSRARGARSPGCTCAMRSTSSPSARRA